MIKIERLYLLKFCRKAMRLNSHPLLDTSRKQSVAELNQANCINMLPLLYLLANDIIIPQRVTLKCGR